MLIIISTRAVREQFSGSLGKYMAFDNWIAVQSPPSSLGAVEAVLKKHHCGTGGQVMVFAKYGKTIPASYEGMFAGHWLISQVFYITLSDVNKWISALSAFREKQPRQALVTGMMKPFYNKWCERIYKTLRTERYGKETRKYLSDNYTSTELARKLSAGAALAVYVGHGRSRGWSGYRGFRWEHMEAYPQQAPLGTLLSLSCGALKDDRDHRIPFGVRWVTDGRACCVIAAVEAVQIRPLEVITALLLEGLSQPDIANVAQLMAMVQERILSLGNSDVTANWNKFRVVGNAGQELELKIKN